MHHRLRPVAGVRYDVALVHAGLADGSDAGERVAPIAGLRILRRRTSCTLSAARSCRPTMSLRVTQRNNRPGLIPAASSQAHMATTGQWALNGSVGTWATLPSPGWSTWEHDRNMPSPTTPVVLVWSKICSNGSSGNLADQNCHRTP